MLRSLVVRVLIKLRLRKKANVNPVMSMEKLMPILMGIMVITNMLKIMSKYVPELP